MVKQAIIDGQLVLVTVCPPSRRRKASSIQKPRVQKHSGSAVWLAKDNGQIQRKDDQCR